MQCSLENTSLKLGRFITIWGEVDGNEITDIISPRDYSELFFVKLEDSRMRQEMVTLNQYTSFGNFNLFYIPKPSFNRLPDQGTEYYIDIFGEGVEIKEDKKKDNGPEFGIRWIKNFEKGNVSLMYANLLENEYSYEFIDEIGPETLLEKSTQRFQMIGATVSYTKGSFLWKGEFAKKTSLTFADSNFNLYKNEVIDYAASIEYSGSLYSIGIDIDDRYVLNWEKKISDDVQEHNTTITFCCDRNFLNNDLTIEFETSYLMQEYAIEYSLDATYQFNDYLKFEGEVFVIDVSNKNSSLWEYKDQDRLSVRMVYQF